MGGRLRPAPTAVEALGAEAHAGALRYRLLDYHGGLADLRRRVVLAHLPKPTGNKQS